MFVLIGYQSGRLMSRRTVDKLLEVMRERIEEAKLRETISRETAELERRRADVAVRQTNELLELAHTGNAVLKALPPRTTDREETAL